jgi:hypothetical protein
MNILLIVLAIVGIVLLLTGGFVHALQVLLYIGILLLVIAVIVYLINFLTGRRRTL